MSDFLVYSSSLSCLLCIGACGYAVYWLKKQFSDFFTDPLGYIWAFIKYLLGLPDSYTNGAGKPLQCSDDENQILALCYPKCPPGSKGTSGIDLFCWKDCPHP